MATRPRRFIDHHFPPRAAQADGQAWTERRIPLRSNTTCAVSLTAPRSRGACHRGRRRSCRQTGGSEHSERAGYDAAVGGADRRRMQTTRFQRKQPIERLECTPSMLQRPMYQTATCPVKYSGLNCNGPCLTIISLQEGRLNSEQEFDVELPLCALPIPFQGQLMGAQNLCSARIAVMALVVASPALAEKGKLANVSRPRSWQWSIPLAPNGSGGGRLTARDRGLPGRQVSPMC